MSGERPEVATREHLLDLLHQGESVHSIQAEQRPMAPVDVLRLRLKTLANMDLPPAPPGAWEYGVATPYWYHPREWAEGYIAAAKDFLKVIGEGDDGR